MKDIVDRLRFVIGSETNICGEAAAEIENLRTECRNLANILMSEYTWVHEYKIEEVDAVLKPYLGTEDDAPAKSTAAS